MSTKDIVPFKCSKCGDEFSELEGGVCYFCNKPFCTSHLLTVFIDKKDRRYVCLNCKIKYMDKKNKKED